MSIRIGNPITMFAALQMLTFVAVGSQIRTNDSCKTPTEQNAKKAADNQTLPAADNEYFTRFLFYQNLLSGAATFEHV